VSDEQAGMTRKGNRMWSEIMHSLPESRSLSIRVSLAGLGRLWLVIDTGTKRGGERKKWESCDWSGDVAVTVEVWLCSRGVADALLQVHFDIT
jgi:hypothetical protein